MHIRHLAPALVACCLACASTEPKPTPTALAPDAGVAAIAPAASAGTHGVDISSMDTSAAPGDDFFQFASGAWLTRTDIPADVSRWGTFSVLNETSQQRTRDLLEAAAASSAPAGSDQRKVGDFYASYLDEEAVETRGIEPLKPQLTAIAALRDKTALARALGKDLRT